jgi:antitoxin ParD1/3/4
MNFSLTPALEKFIRERAESEDYNNASEVVREALRLLKQREELQALKLERLRQAVQAGDAALADGAYTEFATDAELDRFFADL